MEIDVRQRRNQRNRRRERAQRMQAERDRDVVAGGEPDDSADEESSKPPVREKPPQRRKKPKELSPLLEEDIIDGFAILAFKAYEDLEVSYTIVYNQIKYIHTNTHVRNMFDIFVTPIVTKWRITLKLTVPLIGLNESYELTSLV